MSVLTMDHTPSPVRRLRGLYWLTWRQNRLLLWAVPAIVVLGSAWFVQQHLALSSDLGALHPTPACYGWGGPCTGAQLGLAHSGHRYMTYVKPLMAVLPLLVGMFVGAPLVAQEHERGTARLAWSQSVSRTRWLAVELAVPAVPLALGTAVLAGLCTWYVRSATRGGVLGDSPFQDFEYQTVGLVPVALVLFSLALGTVVGMLLRRVPAAMVVTGGLLLAVQAGLVLLRPHLYPAVHGEQPHAAAGYDVRTPPGAWRLSDGGDYHPLSQFVPIQLIESGLLLVLTAGLVAFAFRRVRRSAA